MSYSSTTLAIPETPLELSEKREEVIAVCQTFLHDQRAYRGDYKELAELALLYLNDTDTKANFTKFLKPGALHSARFMALILYSVKIVLLSPAISELPKGAVLTASQLQRLQRFVQFTIYVYVLWWLTASFLASAPLHDISLILSLKAAM